MLRSHRIPIDIAILQVTPPDKYGFCSLGINVDVNKTVADVAKILILHLNPNMPYTNGNSCIKFQEADYFLVQDTPLLEYALREPPNVNFAQNLQKIGQYLAKLIEDGSTINMGIGKLPPRMWEFLGERKNLAIYSEVVVLTDTLIELIKQGVITCKLNQYPHILTSFVLGRRPQYQFLDRNPIFEFQPIEWLNAINNIAKNKKLCSIYSALAVDLTGQITNHLPGRFYSGIGGEHDFIQGTTISPSGKTIIILESTTHDLKTSRITAQVAHSSIPASDVHYVITEWGIARLDGKSVRDRALQLINIAHPNFRAQLLAEAKELRLVYSDQMLPTTEDGRIVIYPERYDWLFETKIREVIHFRPVKPTDEAALQQFMYHLDEEDKIMRFFSPKKIFPHEQTQMEVNIDYITVMSLVGVQTQGTGLEEGEIVCFGGYYAGEGMRTNQAEIATVIAKTWQKKGLGTFLFQKLIQIGIENGFSGFYGEYAAQNRGIFRILSRLPFNVTFHNYEDSVEFLIHFRG